MLVQSTFVHIVNFAKLGGVSLPVNIELPLDVKYLILQYCRGTFGADFVLNRRYSHGLGVKCDLNCNYPYSCEPNYLPRPHRPTPQFPVWEAVHPYWDLEP